MDAIGDILAGVVQKSLQNREPEDRILPGVPVRGNEAGRSIRFRRRRKLLFTGKLRG